jgi:hypothetical protein
MLERVNLSTYFDLSGVSYQTIFKTIIKTSPSPFEGLHRFLSWGFKLIDHTLIAVGPTTNDNQLIPRSKRHPPKTLVTRRMTGNFEEIK